jgi:ribonuclease D
MEMLTAPEGGTPEVITEPAELAKAIAQLRSGTGPIAIDAERASGYRYSARAYLIQLFRRGGGLHLIDPIPLKSSKEVKDLQDVIASDESVIHASSQDLACLREFGLDPKKLFDTELGGRIAGFARVGLGSLVEELLGVALAKEHSAVDWSIRPLRQEWLDYAALDVALLVDLRDAVHKSLSEQGKLSWAESEFAASLAAPPQKSRRDPWRRTSGMHQIKSRFELALIRELWLERDQIAADIDLAPGRLLSDAVIVEFAMKKPKSESDLNSLPIIKEKIRNDLQRSYLTRWWQVLSSAYAIGENNWPEMRARGDGLPPPRTWRTKFPLASAHLQNARLRLQEIAESKNLPVENLISPDSVKRITFDGGKERRFEDGEKLIAEVELALRGFGAREWQIALVAPAIAAGLLEDKPPAAPAPERDPESEPAIEE